MSCTHLQMATVDFIDNFQVPGQQMSKQVHRPAFQSFRKDCVISVSTCTHTDVPGLYSKEMNSELCILSLWR